jgi:hypothetical protein
MRNATVCYSIYVFAQIRFIHECLLSCCQSWLYCTCLYLSLQSLWKVMDFFFARHVTIVTVGHLIVYGDLYVHSDQK